MDDFQDMYEELDDRLKSDYSATSYARAKQIVNSAYLHCATIDSELSELLIWTKPYDMSGATSGLLPQDFRKMYKYTYPATTGSDNYVGNEGKDYYTAYSKAAYTNAGGWQMYDMDDAAISVGDITYYYIPDAMTAAGDIISAPKPIWEIIEEYAIYLGMKDDGEEAKEIDNQLKNFLKLRDEAVNAYNPANYGQIQRPKDLYGKDIYDVGEIW